MNASIFLSYPKPAYLAQEQFIERITAALLARSLTPRTLGVTDYDLDAPLTAIRRLMQESNGLITIAFRRTFVEKGTGAYQTDVAGRTEVPLIGQWLTTPWAHIEPAMAFQLGLPTMILRETGVIADGVLERGVTGLYMPEVDLSRSLDSYFSSPEWNQLFHRFELQVRTVVEHKGSPPRLY